MQSSEAETLVLGVTGSSISQVASAVEDSVCASLILKLQQPRHVINIVSTHAHLSFWQWLVRKLALFGANTKFSSVIKVLASHFHSEF